MHKFWEEKNHIKMTYSNTRRIRVFIPGRNIRTSPDIAGLTSKKSF
jgi:hypothetical protein